MKIKTICIIGNYSGRNAGDAAMLEGMMSDIRARYRDVRFVVPTWSPAFIRKTYARFPVEPVGISPAHGAVKLVGLPAWRAMRDADLVLITDAILFDRNLLNPIHNYLAPLSLMLPALRKAGVPIVLYNVSIGPVATLAGQWCLKRVLRTTSSIILRDDESLRTLAPLELEGLNIAYGADSALLAEPSPEPRLREVMAKLGIDDTFSYVGVNMNRYGAAFLRRADGAVTQEGILTTMADLIEKIRVQLGARACLFSTQHMDESVVRRLQERAGGENVVPMASNRALSYSDLIALFSKMKLVVGMRTHSMILSSSVGTPMVGIITYPKTYGYLKRIGFEDYSLPVDHIAEPRMWRMIERAWRDLPALREKLRVNVAKERAVARAASELLAPMLTRSSSSSVLVGR